MPTIRHVLADIGGVTLSLDFRAAAARMAAHCGAGGRIEPEKLLSAFYGDPVLVDYECGRIGRGDFVAHFRRKLSFRGDDAEFVAIWRSVFTANRPMIDFWRSLAGQWGIWYFSNTGEMHVPWVYGAFPEMTMHRGHALSYEVGVMKPDARFFRTGLDRLGLRPDECLFVDDLEENCAGARACGIESIRYTDAPATQAAVCARLGLPEPSATNRPCGAGDR